MRPLLRRGLVVLGLLVIAALAALLVFDLVASRRLAAARERFAAEVAPLDYASLKPPALDGAANAATWIQAGASALVQTPEQGEAAADLVFRRGSSWDAAERRRAAELVAAAGPAFELLERSLPLARSDFGIDYASGIEAQVPDLMALLRVIRLARIDGSLAILEGQRARVLRDLALIGRVADALADESLLVTAIVAIGADRRYLDLLAEALPLLAPDDLEAIASDLARRDRRPALERALRAEATLVARTPLSELMSAGVAADGWTRRPAAWLSAGWYKAETAVALDTFRVLIGNLRRSAPAGDARIAAVEESAWSPILVPNLRWTIVSQRGNETARLLAASAVATRQTAIAAGGYPAAPVLVPGADPDPLAGGAITYERRADGSAVLAAPAAEEQWRERSRQPSPPFVWRLPPVD